MQPILPLRLKIEKPKHWRYPKEILTVGEELRKARMDRGLTQHQVAEMIGVNRNFVYEFELNKRTHTIFALHKVYLFLGYLPRTLNIDETSLIGEFFAYRIRKGFTLKEVAQKINIDKSILGRFYSRDKVKKETVNKIEKYLTENC